MENTPYKATPNPSSPIPKTLGNLQVLEELGRGGMGTVYKVWDPHLKRTLALKTLQVQIGLNMQAIQRFLLEIRTISQLNHPNIIRLYNVGQEQGIHYFTMDYIQGLPLDQYVKENKASLRKRAILMQKVAKAMHYAHKKGIIHRDLKPDNVMVDHKEEPYVMDFGLAKAKEGGHGLTQTGQLLGTPHYMSPEQAKGKHDLVDERSDIYSLGAIFYTLLTEKCPFEADSLMELFDKIATEDPIEPRKLNDRIPKTLENICFQAIAKNKEKRYPTALALAEDLNRFAFNKQVKATRRTTFHKVQSRYRKHLALYIFVISSILVCFYGAWKYFSVPTAIKKRKKIKTASISNATRAFRYASNLIQMEFYERAYEYLEKTLAKPEDVKINNIYQKLVVVLTEINEYKKALDFYQKLQPKWKDTPKLHLAMAKVHYYLEQFEKSLLFLNKLKSSSSSKIVAESSYYRALIYFGQKDYKKALEFFKRSYSAKKDNTLLLFYMGASYFHQSQLKKAIYYLQKAKEHFPKQLNIYEYLGKCYLQTNSQKAVEFFTKCIELQPYNGAHYTLLAEAQIQQNQYLKADKALAKALKLNTGDIRALKCLLTLASKEPALRSASTASFSYYLAKISKGPAPLLFYSEFAQMQHSYYNSYLQWQTMQNLSLGKPKVFLKILQNSSNQKIVDGAMQGLVSLRYYKGIEEKITQIMNVSKKTDELCRQVLQIIKQKKQREQKLANYYRLAHIYLQKSSSIQKEITNTSPIIRILEDPKERVLHRYLAAKALLKLLDFKTVESKKQSLDKIEALICNCVWNEAGFGGKLFLPEKISSLPKNDFLRAIVVRNILIHIEYNKNRRRNYRMYSKNLKKFASFLNSTSDAVRLSAAVNVFTNVYNPELTNRHVRKAKDVLKEIIKKHPSKYFRAYAHYYLWESKNLKDLFFVEKKYEKIYRIGLLDSSVLVNKMVLRYAHHFDIKSLSGDLLRISKKYKNTHLEILAIHGLCSKNPAHPIIDQIVNNPNSSLLLRVFTYFSSIYYRIHKKRGKSKLSLLTQIPKIMKKFSEQLNTVVNDPDISFKLTVYYLGSMFGHHPVEQLEKADNVHVQAGILMNLCNQGYSFATRLFSQKVVTKNDKIKFAKKYLKHSNPNVCRSAFAAIIVLLDKKTREKMYHKIKHSTNNAVREGVAMGLYSLSHYATLKKVPLDKLIKPDLSVEDQYFRYLGEMVKIVKNSVHQRKNFLKWLSRAIILKERPEYYLERGTIYRELKKYDLAIADFRKGAILAEDYSLNKVELAKTLLLANRSQEVPGILDRALQTTVHKGILEDIAWLYIQLGLFQKAEKIFKRLYLESKGLSHHIALAILYSHQKKYTLALKYLIHLHELDYKKRKRSKNYIPRLNKRVLKKYKVLSRFLKHRWTPRLPK